MKEWFLDRFLPMWAKETVLADNRRLEKEVTALQQKLRQLEAYTKGLQNGLRSGRKITIQNGGGE